MVGRTSGRSVGVLKLNLSGVWGHDWRAAEFWGSICRVYTEDNWMNTRGSAVEVVGYTAGTTGGNPADLGLDLSKIIKGREILLLDQNKAKYCSS